MISASGIAKWNFPAKHPLEMRAIILLLAIAYPYLCRLCGFPCMDEGSYAYNAVIYHVNISQGQPLAPIQGLALWPLLLAWVPELPGIPLLWLRIADLLAALLAGWLFCAILARECGSRSWLIALVFLLCMTDQHVIENGFKNSFFPAWACFFGAVLLAAKARQKPGLWLLIGCLTAFGILLRETFFPFCLLGLIAVWRIGGKKAAWRYCLGGIVLTMLIFCLLEWLAPGSLASLYKGYADRVLIYQEQTQRFSQNLAKYSRRSLLLFSPALGLFLAVFLWQRFFGKTSWSKLPLAKLSFWAAVAIIPLYETLVKISFYYHFATALPGLACLTAIFAAQPTPGLKEAWQSRRKVAASLLALGLASFVFAFKSLPSPAGLVHTFTAFSQLQKGSWPKEMIEKSTTLQVVELLDKNTAKNATVSINGMGFFILIADRRLPPLSGPLDPDDNNLMGDLGRFYLQTGKNTQRLKNAILANPPDAIALMLPKGDHEPTFSREIKDILISTGKYEKFATVDPDADGNRATNYDMFAYDLYRLKKNK